MDENVGASPGYALRRLDNDLNLSDQIPHGVLLEALNTRVTPGGSDWPYKEGLCISSRQTNHTSHSA